MKEPGNGNIALTCDEGKKEEEQLPPALDYTDHRARNKAEYPYEWNFCQDPCSEGMRNRREVLKQHGT